MSSVVLFFDSSSESEDETEANIKLNRYRRHIRDSTNPLELNEIL